MMRGDGMENLYVIAPNEDLSEQLQLMIEAFGRNFDSVIYIREFKDCLCLKDKKILFVLELGFTGFDLPMLKFFESLKNKDNDIFYGSIASLLVHSSSELGTKGAAQDIVFMANNLGCSFIGHPLIEATKSLRNFLTWQKTLQIPLKDICTHLCSNLGKRLLDYKNVSHDKTEKNITVLYSSPHKVSNTLELWHMASKNLTNFIINEIQIENGEILDCKGCSYTLCLHYGKKNRCFYGGFMTENVLPAIEKADSIVWLCPNYNDAIAANLTATINRLTVLYHKTGFHDKSTFGVIVSGNSGSDSVAKQLIGALNINKGFKLPPYAIITETANDPNSIFKIEGIENKAKIFAKHMAEGL